MNGASGSSTAIPEAAGAQEDSLDGSNSRRRRPPPPTVEDDDVAPLPSIARRSSSFRLARRESSIGDSRRSVQSSTDSLFVPRPTDEKEGDHEPSLWYSAPLLFAIFPAIGGVVFKKGSVLLTDLALLVLAALYLNWCLVTPWIWYHSAQSVKVADFQEEGPSLGTLDDALGENVSPDETLENNTEATAKEQGRPQGSKTAEPSAALHELRLHELTALTLCFLGPLLGSYVLHLIRAQLSTLGDELVSNLHLTLFVLGAEIRPLRHAMKMAQARTIYLQRVVRTDPHKESDADNQATIKDLTTRLDELETGFADKVANNDFTSSSRSAENEEAVKKVQSSLQTQVDALNRAVRRYEKRAATQTMQTEARLHDLETRLKEAVSLAAAAATYSQKPGTLMLVLNWLKSAVFLPLRAAWKALIYPFQLARISIIQLALRSGFVQKNDKKPQISRPTSNGTKSGGESASRKSRKSAA